MTYATHSIRLAGPALVAVLALSSTPLNAQSVETGGDAPVISAPAPAPTVSAPVPVLSAPVVDAPVVAAPAPIVAAPAPIVAAPAPMRTQSAPVEYTGDDTAETRAAPVTRTARPAARIATVTEAPAAAPTAPATVERVAEAPPPPVVAPAPTAAPVESVRADSNNDVAEFGAVAAIGLLAAGGLAYGLSRRRRRDDTEDLVLEDTVYEPVATPSSGLAAAPVLAATTAPAVASGPSHLHSGFDLSRFGPHVQAAYRGPTPENPSHSLRKRLKRAAFFEQQARYAAAAGETPRYTAPVTKAAQDDQIVVRAGKQRPGNYFTLGNRFGLQR